MSSVLEGRRIVLGVTGSVAIFKACELVGHLRRSGADVLVVMTRAAGKLASPDLFRSLSGREVAQELFGSDLGSNPHIELAAWADLVAVAPATANLVGKIAAGVADDLLSTLIMASGSPVLMAPAMNVRMWENPVVQGNIEKLKGLGYHVVEGEAGWLACGAEGKGRMAEVPAIVEAIEEAISSATGDLGGRTVLITAGRTEEPIDAVRYISNRSSGKTGWALAREAVRRGARVVYISGPTSTPAPAEVEMVPVTSAEDMAEAVLDRFPNADVLVMAAAVADYKPSEVHDGKIRKKAESLDLTLVPTQDILSLVREKRSQEQVVVGFALETENEIGAARSKLKEKGLDLIVANNPVASGTGFGEDSVAAAILDSGPAPAQLEVMTKDALAKDLFDRIVARLEKSGE